MRSLPAFPRRPVSAYECGVFTGREEYKTHKHVKITPFEINPPNMETVCCKMTESIIINPNTLDKANEPLCFKSF
jgi:hypothetical protein